MKIKFNENTYTCRDDETLLESFLRQGVNVPFSCRNGVCHACLLRATDGKPPAAAQQGIKQHLIDKNYFMSCKCRPDQDMEISLPRPADILTRAVVYQKELLAGDVCRLLLEPATQVYYHAGQFINLRRDDGLTRSYSLASVPQSDYFIELHVRLVPGGRMSEWIFKTLEQGDEIEFHGPLGESCYRTGNRDRNLLLISTSTGIAPHIGIARDALLSGHTGKIELYHGSRHSQGHYLAGKLRKLDLEYPNFSYHLCCSGEASGNALHGRANEIALSHIHDPENWLTYLSGNPAMVSSTRETLQKRGIDDENIITDPFEYDHRAGARQDESGGSAVTVERRKFPDPDPEMWEALEQGALMTTILSDFYTRVFEDEKLKPYFRGVTRQRLIEKVYNFHYQMFTGEKVYFGDRPKNAHHWMVISDELFDYRESIMEDCLRKHGLAEHLIRRWMSYEEMYREDIVKDKPVNKMLFGMEMPADGFDEIEIGVSTLCDSCGGEINAGETVRYHTRLGSTYCRQCMQSGAQAL